VSAAEYDLVVVANRLPVDFTVDEDGEVSWTRSPGGLVTALEPMMQASDGAWIGWSGAPDLAHEPFDGDDIRLVPVTLSAEEVQEYYEGFANDTLWPLYHDVITAPQYHRQWWETYRSVNHRFAEAAAAHVAPGGTVWVQDYQLQLVPAMLRELRPDVRIGFFNHIPFPGLEIFAQLPWRRQIVDGLLGADVVGFQRASDATNFVRAVRRLTDLTTRRGQRSQIVTVPGGDGPDRYVRVAPFPISIDSRTFDGMARSEEVQRRAREIRVELGSPDVLLLGVDRLDYTKGISHRIKAFGELVRDGRLSVPQATLVQVASPSRENVEAYQQLREEVELLVGRINGDFGQLGHPAVHYMHHSYPPSEMAALYLAADVMLVTALRDGMNLVAKEYVAARSDDRGVLVLSEFTGAADELTHAVTVNPHDIDGLKDSIVAAVEMDPREQRRRMRRLRKKVLTNDVAKWSQSFLSVLAAVPVAGAPDAPAEPGEALAEADEVLAAGEVGP
jgi:alpha,alpha-trehalose-phosphate synthase [UDP-forming]